MLASADALMADPHYHRLKRHVVGSTGLAYYNDKDVDLARRFRHRMATAGVPDCASYLDILCDPLRGPSELDALIEAITIGETYFFRHLEHFNALRDLVLPDLIARNAASRCLRVWCAGCADGPEPYSLAILMRRELAHLIQGWKVTILGTDINRNSLARAREGKFEEWAFRSMCVNLKHSCFSKEGKVWSIAPEYKEWVSFQYHNLVEDSFPSLVNNLFSFDLIVCRNAMIYFGPDLMKRLVEKFHASLVPGGWLLVGPSEPNMTCFTSFRAVNAPGVTFYQKPRQTEPSPQLNLIPMAWLSPEAPVPHRDSTKPDPPPEEGAPLALAQTTLADVRRYADLGAWKDAARCCQQLLEDDNLNSTSHFYNALILEQIGKLDESERSLRRAIYLDRGSVLAHYYLGIFLQSRRRSAPAARSFENVLELLQARSDADAFAEADGITTAELRKSTKMHLDTLHQQI